MRTEPAPELAPAVRPQVRALATACGLASGAALVVSIVTDRPLWLASTFVLVPGFVAFVGLTVIARRTQQRLYLARVKAGALAGALGTLAYDVSRWSVETLGLTGTDSFRALPVFGSGLTGLPTTHAASLAAGWAFHLVNGIGFAIAYLMVAAGRRWPLAVLYALVLEAFMVALYPDWLGLRLTREFVSVGILGHVGYGVAVGLVAERTP